ncbi:3-isopropylmalate dehydratase small subunit [Ligilactobacillus sp. WILCCON 0076]|uniref:3-isopropylmalate dehydratase small subunit n=1 Tax=Ligilactobacillus ubinensis TaxID=2876789 RepID=A0A9X2FFZ2_9LACO|nr:3-isopropylmalate dehydratase small subunit [Ligilactobacillus ubinensis]MCP0885802.1 3-isopropylmalate dehydratase small subunit [Ligilactobacillus ubinensis]
MDPITVHTGRTVALMNDNIDTDQIIPKQFLKNILKTGYANSLFFDWRYDDAGKPNKDFELNKPERQGASILITGSNFGCGSSREHAAWALKDWGFRVIIAGGYSDIFYMNCTKNGILPVVLPQNARDYLAKIASQEEITIDLPNQEVCCGKEKYHFDFDQTWKQKFINGDDDIDITMAYQQQIEEYEQKLPVFWQ